jgi:hypothetical protein
MNRFVQKSAQYGAGLEKINELIILNLAVKEPEMLTYNPDIDTVPEEGQLTQLDPSDPITFVTFADFQPPLPMDKIVLLNELSQKISMGLESKEGALRALGEEFPTEKLSEIRRELQDDAMADGALNLVRIQIQKQIMDMTGMMPGPDGTGTPLDPMMMGDGDTLGDGQIGPAGEDPAAQQVVGENFNAQEQIRQSLLQEAYGNNPPTRRELSEPERQE